MPFNAWQSVDFDRLCGAQTSGVGRGSRGRGEFASGEGVGKRKRQQQPRLALISCLSAYEISKQPAEKYLYKYPATPAAQQVIQAVTHRTVNPLCNSWPIKKVNQGIGGELGLLSYASDIK